MARQFLIRSQERQHKSHIAALDMDSRSGARNQITVAIDSMLALLATLAGQPTQPERALFRIAVGHTDWRWARVARRWVVLSCPAAATPWGESLAMFDVLPNGPTDDDKRPLFDLPTTLLMEIRCGGCPQDDRNVTPKWYYVGWQSSG